MSRTIKTSEKTGKVSREAVKKAVKSVGKKYIFDGIVVEVDTKAKAFIARLLERKDGCENYDILEADFKFEDVPADKQELIKEGSAFCWELNSKDETQSIEFDESVDWKGFNFNSPSKKVDEIWKLLKGGEDE